MATEVEISGETYRIGKIDGWEQVQLITRLLPGLQPLLPLWSNAAQNQSVSLFAMMAAVSDAFVLLTDEQRNYVRDRCLAVVRRRQGGNGQGPTAFVEIKPSNASGRLMFDDINADGALQLVLIWQVLQENLTNFLPALLRHLGIEIPLQSSSSPLQVVATGP